jgi:hypothetical protein
VKANFFLANFCNLTTKKKVGEFNKGIFEIKKKSPYLDQKNLEVTIFRESCVPIGRQN